MPSGITLNKISELQRSMLNCNVFSVYDYDCLSMQELLCTFFEKINQCVDVTNKTVVLVEWLVSQGLNEEVAKKLESWLVDGTLANIINETVFKELNNKVRVNSQNIESLSGKLNEHMENANTKFNNINHNLDSVFVFSDNYPSLQEAHDAVVAKGGGTLIINKDYVIDKGFKWDCSKVIIDGHGHKIVSSTLNREFVMYVRNSNPETHPYYQAQFECRNLAIKHNNKANGGIYFDSVPNKALSHITFRNCSIEDTQLALWLKNSAYLLKFVDCDIFNNKEVFLVSAGANDSGENIQFRGCAIYNNTAGFRSDNGNCDIFLDSCSLDYNEVGSVVNLTNAKMFINNCHIEHASNRFKGGTVPFVVNGDAGQLFINNSLIMFSDANNTTMPNIFYAQGGNSTITLTNNFLYGCKTTTGYLCGGDGRMPMRGNRVNIVPECNLAIHPSNTTSAVGSMLGDRLVDIYLTEDSTAITELKTTGTNGNITIDKQKSLKFGRSVKVTKTAGSGSAFAIRAIFPIDKMSINNVRMQISKASGSGDVNISYGYCLPGGNGQDFDSSQGTESSNLGTGDWMTFEKTMMTAPSWATHGYVNIATSNADNIVFNIGEIVSNSI